MPDSTIYTNEYGQPIGAPLPGWSTPPYPAAARMEGRYCRLDPLDLSVHAQPLYDALANRENDARWTYLPYGPFDSFDAWADGFVPRATRAPAASVAPPPIDPLVFVITRLPDAAPSGVAGYLRITPGAGSIEVGHLHFGARLQRSAAATEAMYLMMEHAFTLGYRRYEWKCDAFNAASRSAALRLGFTFEGVFRNATVYKGRSRDTAWFSIIHAEWQALRTALREWLDPANFDADGRQRSALAVPRAAS